MCGDFLIGRKNGEVRLCCYDLTPYKQKLRSQPILMAVTNTNDLNIA
jgi:hypothetical protein